MYTRQIKTLNYCLRSFSWKLRESCVVEETYRIIMKKNTTEKHTIIKDLKFYRHFHFHF